MCKLAGDLTVCTWNAQGLTEDKIPILLNAAKTHSWDITMLTETWQPLSGHRRLTDRWALLLSAADNGHAKGVGFLLSPTAASALLDFQPVSDRVATITVATTHGKAGLTVGYAPAQSSTATDIEVSTARTQFWDSLRKHTPKGHLQIIAGDFNATLGPEDAVTTHIGPHGRGHTTCPNGHELLTFTEGRFFLENTLHEAAWHGTWVRPDGVEATAAKDFIATNAAAHRITSGCRTLRETGISSDHYPVVAKFAIRAARGTRAPKEPKGSLNRRWLRDLVPPHRPDEEKPPETAERLAVRQAVREFAASHPATVDVEDLYSRINTVTQHIYTNIMPPPTRTEKPWMTLRLLEFITSKNKFCDRVRNTS
jgi:exonuclease III